MADNDSELPETTEPETTLDSVREHIREIGITESDIADAVAWARGKLRPTE